MPHTSLNNHTHAVMFHHFHDEKHPIGQGSLSAGQFADMLDWLSERYTLLSADEYTHKFKQGALATSDVCLTFDDALLCQAEIAGPILKQRNLQAFFFVYSSPFAGTPDFLEIYRHFRTTEFKSMDDFYAEFFVQAEKLFESDFRLAEKAYEPNTYLAAFPFYTAGDRWFRFLRDITLGKERYEEVMRLLMVAHGFDPRSVLSSLWMSDRNLHELRADGHTIGLHSYTHPTSLHLLNRASQQDEYDRNYKHLSDVLGTSLHSMSHPCGNYNDDTLDILRNKGIGIGFRSSNSIRSIRSPLEIPREDHANVLKEMAK